MKSLLIIAILCLNAVAAQAQTFDTDDAVIIKSTVGPMTIGICSGVLLNETTVLTAAHCIEHSTLHQVGFHNFRYRASAQDDQSTQMHPSYDRTISNSKYDIGVIRLNHPISPRPGYAFKKECKETHVDQTVYQAGFGGRPSGNLKTVLSLKAEALSPNRLSLKTIDDQSVSGDSGAPVYAIEQGEACILGIHSTFNGLDAAIPSRLVSFSYNTLLSKTFYELR